MNFGLQFEACVYDVMIVIYTVQSTLDKVNVTCGRLSFTISRVIYKVIIQFRLGEMLITLTDSIFRVPTTYIYS